jgi:SAM-dependent methyltransferase
LSTLPASPFAENFQVEDPTCPLCGHDITRPGYRFPPYAVVRCAACGFWYLKPRLREAEMRAHYAADVYFEGGEGLGYASYLVQESTLRSTFRRLAGTMARRGMVGGRLLEVGCAYGFFLEEARPYFRERVGTDYSPAAAERARARAERVVLGGLEALPAGEFFDVAVCIHVIEHVYRPLEFLRELRQRLRPGGWIVLATPHMGGFWRPLLGRRWPFFKVPEHVTYFDRRSLRLLLAKTGCVQVQELPYESRFSLALIGEKLGWHVPASFASWTLPLPGTTIAAAGRREE